ncbi:hypothetical protein ACPMJQ_28435 [Streptomyces pseudogriseolus]
MTTASRCWTRSASSRARSSGSCAMTSTASSSTTTPHRIPHIPV